MFLVLAAGCAAAGRLAAAEALLLAEGGQSSHSIVTAADAPPPVRHAAQELQMFLQQISGAKLPIVSDRQPPTGREILVGPSARLRQIAPELDLAALGPEGYWLLTVGDRLVIAGGPPRGTLYGVYGLLEDHLGCRWFTPEVSRIPACARLAIGPLRERRVPVLEYREPYTRDCFDGDWCARNRVNSSAASLEAKHGGKIRFADGFFVHTFNRLVPPEKYFDRHPEYFSLVGGKRLRQETQLCTTSPEVVRLCSEAIRRAMREQPEATVFSVSQNDCGNYCQCERCQALARAEGSQIAPVLALVNRVAESIEREFPGRSIETLAYQWTRHAPRTLRPRPNVIVRLCSIECCFSHPLATCDSAANRAFREDAAAWAKVADRLWVWDYVTDFSHYLLPFPNQRVRRENIRFFVRHNVRGIFEQDTYDTPGSELAALGGYVTAKFLWNPDYDEQTAFREFLSGYYGRADEPIRRYLDLLHDRVARENIHVAIWAGPESPHLADDLLLTANGLWQEAQSRVADQPEVQRRVQIARMSVDYAILERARLEQAKRLPPNPALGAAAAARFQPFFQVLRPSGLVRLREGSPLEINSYQDGLAKALHLDAAAK
jgi:hypothetical protein